MLLNCTAKLTYQDKSGAETSSALSCGLPALEFWLMVLGQPVHCKCQFKRSKYRISGLLLAAGERRARLGCTNHWNKGQGRMIFYADLPLESQNWKCNAKDLTKPSGNWHLRPCSSKHMISGAQVRRNSRLKLIAEASASLGGSSAPILPFMLKQPCEKG